MPLRTPAAAATPTDLPTGSIAQSFERRANTTATAVVSGRLTLTAIYLRAGVPVTNAMFYTNTTALAGGSHGWAALYDPSLNLLGQTPNDTGITWAAQAKKTFTFTSPVTPTVTGWHYLGLMVVATTMPTISSLAPLLAINQETPALGWLSTTGLTTTAPATASGSVTTASVMYCAVS